jgi:hypothetical protein
MGLIVGNQKAIAVTFYNSSGAVADPTGVTFKFRTPAGTVTTYTYGVDSELVKDATGQYHVLITASLAGIYQWRFAGTGAVIAAIEDSFSVDFSHLA